MMQIKNNHIDFHTHILPKADHGSSGIEESAQQLSILCEARIDRVVATPHFYPDEMLLDDFLKRRDTAADNIKNVISEASPLIYPAAEVLICKGLEEMHGLERLCISGTNCILLEHPFYGADRDIVMTAVNIRKAGLYPVMVHIDRYDKEVVNMIFEAELPCQVNVDAFAHFFKKKEVLKYVEYGAVCSIGTDIHGADRECIKNYEKARKILGRNFDRIMDRSAEILNDAMPIK